MCVFCTCVIWKLSSFRDLIKYVDYVQIGVQLQNFLFHLSTHLNIFYLSLQNFKINRIDQCFWIETKWKYFKMKKESGKELRDLKNIYSIENKLNECNEQNHQFNYEPKWSLCSVHWNKIHSRYLNFFNCSTFFGLSFFGIPTFRWFNVGFQWISTVFPVQVRECGSIVVSLELAQVTNSAPMNVQFGYQIHRNTCHFFSSIFSFSSHTVAQF